MKGRAAVVGVLVWVLTVVVAAAVTWQVIDAAGQDVLAESTPSSTNETVSPAGPSPSVATTSAGPPSSPDKPPSRTAAPSASSATSAAAAPTTSAAPTPRTEHTPTKSPTASDPTSPTSTPSDPAPEAVRKTWRGAAGTVTVECSSGDIELRGATPADGYRVEVEEEHDAVEVKFSREEPEEDEVKVRATCSGGVPQFQVEDRRSEDSFGAGA